MELVSLKLADRNLQVGRDKMALSAYRQELMFRNRR
jgi:hypothetical protein